MKPFFIKISVALIAVVLAIVVVSYSPKEKPYSYTPSVAQWIKITKSYTDFATAGLTNDIEIFSLPAKGVLHAAIIKHTAAFTGSTIASYTLSVGRTGSLDIWINGSNVFGAPSNTVFYQSETFPTAMNFGSTTSIRSQAIAVGANLNAATAGAVEYYLLISNLP